MTSNLFARHCPQGMPHAPIAPCALALKAKIPGRTPTPSHGNPLSLHATRPALHTINTADHDAKPGRTKNGRDSRGTFATSMQGVVRTTREVDDRTIHHVPLFEPGNDRSPTSYLRLINPAEQDVDITIAGRDDAAKAGRDEVRLSLPGGTACWVNASTLESGASDGDEASCNIIDGRLGNGQGRWRLRIAASGGGVRVMSLLVNPTGHLTNLSSSGDVRSGMHTLPLFFPVSGSKREPDGFVRIVNHSNQAGKVEIHGVDDRGTSYGPTTLTLDQQEAVHLDSGDLEAGNASKGLPEGLGDGEGYWRLRLATELEIEALAYVRKEHEIVTSTHEIASTTHGREGETVHYVPFFNPGTDAKRVSWLRLSNSSRRDVEVTIEGQDSAGMAAPEGVVSLTLPAGQACMLSAPALESGVPESEPDTCTDEQFHLDGRLGDGAGKWLLFVTAGGGDVQVMSLLKSTTGNLFNMSVPNRMPTGRPASRTQLDALPDAIIVEVERWGPRGTEFGEPFNVQPSGRSALWFVLRELDRNTNYKIYVGSRPVDTTENPIRSLITAGLTPIRARELVSTEGKVPIHLVDPFRGKQLIGHFHVQPQ